MKTIKAKMTTADTSTITSNVITDDFTITTSGNTWGTLLSPYTTNPNTVITANTPNSGYSTITIPSMYTNVNNDIKIVGFNNITKEIIIVNGDRKYAVTLGFMDTGLPFGAIGTEKLFTPITKSCRDVKSLNEIWES